MPAATDPSPVSPDEFAARMARLGGFESAPRLAVGVSGGADSLGLVLLAHEWARGQGGSVLGLTVDHGLRPESSDEAERVGQWLADRGIAHAVLHWDGDKPKTGIQAAARAARHRLLAERCRDEGILHLALAHHRDDQAETVLLRLARGSGIDGLAGMAPVRAAGPVRVIRPLLDLPHDRLAATCRAHGQDWIEDPSNRNPAFARARLRAAEDALSAEGLDADRLADSARRAARARAALEAGAASLLAGAAAVYPEGWIRLDPAPLRDAPEELGLRALVRCLLVVGGAPYPPKAEAVERLFAEVMRGLEAGRTLAGRTLGGCRILPRRGGLVIAREPAAATERATIRPSETLWWDRRFTVRLGPESGGAFTVARLGDDGWKSALALDPESDAFGLPQPARASMPALWDEHGLAAVPGLGIFRKESTVSAEVFFTPAMPLAGPAFPVVSAGGGII
ncbi:tRNA lysidine(34) synthetase TilS [Azospirillum canadense]|uniref:tRNA lysidine(34) synthetase TilS n=1 Tax=Azospirillum canadense TaxID=403962 RepID=UPI002227A21E|nr:tRNA lysidine(34) synthetase TilS [Azospirillum canadense]MCW2236540.1 tRNA(Ile)-lysidine synthase [Azospirillum canadense]